MLEVMCNLNENKLVLILTSKWLVAMRIVFELYWVHLIYGMVWFWQWLI
jgi:hypothetical protein